MLWRSVVCLIGTCAIKRWSDCVRFELHITTDKVISCCTRCCCNMDACCYELRCATLQCLHLATAGSRWNKITRLNVSEVFICKGTKKTLYRNKKTNKKMYMCEQMEQQSKRNERQKHPKKVIENAHCSIKQATGGMQINGYNTLYGNRRLFAPKQFSPLNTTELLFERREISWRFVR